MASSFGKMLRVSVFGQSHGEAIGVLAEGFPVGEEVDLERLQRFMDRRRGASAPGSTPRREDDRPRFISGLYNGKTCGAPLCAVIENTNADSSAYKGFEDTPRPGHADYTAAVKYSGFADMRGGGHFSGRLTAPLCAAGGVAKQILERRNIYIGAHIASVGAVRDESFPLFPARDELYAPGEKLMPVINDEAGAEMQRAIEAARADGDSVGGSIECAVIGLPAGVGEPMFETIEGALAYALFGIPAVKGVEFGSGFRAAELRGSENNDGFAFSEDGRVVSASNNSGGVLGGISTGMPLVFRVALKPTPSIGKQQDTVSLGSRENRTISISGRHDACIVPRAVPVVEAAAALVMLDLLLRGGLFK